MHCPGIYCFIKYKGWDGLDEQLSRMMQFIQSMQGESTMDKPGGVYGPTDMLAALRPMLPHKKQRMIDLFTKFLEIQEILNEMKDNTVL